MNRINRLFQIQFPIIQAGMVWASGWRLASAVSNAGGLGLLGSGSMTPELLREHIKKCQAATSLPFGVNVPLLYPEIDQHMKVIREEGVKIVFTSAGNPAKWTRILKENGILVVHVVSSSLYAQKSEEAGVDAIVAEGFEAGGHNGREETTSLVLIPAVCQVVKIPVLAAGGIANGKAMLAAMVLGAEGVQMGSRFLASEEASSHPNFKKAVVHAREGDTRMAFKKLIPVRLLKNKFSQQVQALEDRGGPAEELLQLLGRGRAKLGMFEGNLEEGELEIGQVSALIQDILPASQILLETWEQYQEALRHLLNFNQEI
ncbi:MAG: NAD(P)H-dependent flavin oxidoreductase [Chitinophagaceae bacterium]